MVVSLAGRAAELLALGHDELSSITMANVEHARACAYKLTLSTAMTELPAIGPRVIYFPGELTDQGTGQFGPPDFGIETYAAADDELQRLLQEACYHSLCLLRCALAARMPSVRMRARSFSCWHAGQGHELALAMFAQVHNLALPHTFDLFCALQGHETAYAKLARNREALDALTDRLCEAPYEMTGEEVAELVQQHADPQDLNVLAARSPDAL
jgi:hypothetical protein